MLFAQFFLTNTNSFSLSVKVICVWLHQYGSLNNSDRMSSRLSNSDCIPWLAVLILECLAIVILNIITIIVFVKRRQLQRQSTYLIIHLAIVDLLVGAVSGPLQIGRNLNYCDLRNLRASNKNWSFYLKLAVLHLFSFSSLVNLAFVSLERLHATFRPFKHRFVKKWIYGVIITVIWLTTTARESVQTVLKVKGISLIFINLTLYFSFYLISVFLICVCYVLIVVKVRCSRHPHQHSAASLRERKLTGTSLIVALVSLLCYLPAIIITASERVDNQPLLDLSWRSLFHIRMTALLTFLANSIVNPIIYALRLPGFKAGVSQIFCITFNRAIQPDLPLRNLRPA